MKSLTIILLIFFFVVVLSEDCSNFNGEYGCKNGQHQYEKSWNDRVFQTPPRGDPIYRETYQDMHLLVGFAEQKYTRDKTSCTITFFTAVNPKLGKLGQDYKIIYSFGGEEQESREITVRGKSYPNGMSMSARVVDMAGGDMAKLELEDQYFLWDNVEVKVGDQYEKGQRGAIVELFGWPFDDIAQECSFLGRAGYMAVKVFPASEHILTFDTVEDGELNPWWFLYQPVSYRLHSRMGDRKQLRNM